jgi:hypothetical protein
LKTLWNWFFVGVLNVHEAGYWQCTASTYLYTFLASD